MGAAAQRNHTQKSNECPMDNHYKKGKKIAKMETKNAENKQSEGDGDLHAYSLWSKS